jgi:hypothetical protein
VDRPKLSPEDIKTLENAQATARDGAPSKPVPPKPQ